MPCFVAIILLVNTTVYENCKERVNSCPLLVLSSFLTEIAIFCLNGTAAGTFFDFINVEYCFVSWSFASYCHVNGLM
jgi:hypothetical protein